MEYKIPRKKRRISESRAGSRSHRLLKEKVWYAELEKGDYIEHESGTERSIKYLPPGDFARERGDDEGKGSEVQDRENTEHALVSGP
ncbi:MAG: hypothetical protein AAB655_00510, partial [Patescibacteria group bacterium]